MPRRNDILAAIVVWLTIGGVAACWLSGAACQVSPTIRGVGDDAANEAKPEQAATGTAGRNTVQDLSSEIVQEITQGIPWYALAVIGGGGMGLLIGSNLITAWLVIRYGNRPGNWRRKRAWLAKQTPF